MRASTLKRMKQEAKLLKREYPGLQHTVALEVVAEKFGFTDWAEARRRTADELASEDVNESAN